MNFIIICLLVIIIFTILIFVIFVFVIIFRLNILKLLLKVFLCWDLINIIMVFLELLFTSWSIISCRSIILIIIKFLFIIRILLNSDLFYWVSIIKSCACITVVLILITWLPKIIKLTQTIIILSNCWNLDNLIVVVRLLA